MPRRDHHHGVRHSEPSPRPLILEPGRHDAQLCGRPDAVGIVRSPARRPWPASARGEDGEYVSEKDHGYNFEVPANAQIRRSFDPVPLKDMGRFNHEAVAVDRRRLGYRLPD